MTDRKTEKDARAAMARIAEALGHPVGGYVKDVTAPTRYRAVIGAWDLDYNPTYGGCIVTEIVTDGGGITHPLGDSRETPAVFCAMVRFALRALDTPRRDARLTEWNRSA